MLRLYSFCYNVFMNINQIKQVLTIAEEKNFTNAAKKLFISQPSLSKSIKLLEEELGVELFERNPIKLTHAGESFVSKAKRIMADIGELEIEMSDISTNNPGYSHPPKKWSLIPIHTMYKNEFCLN